MTTLADITKSEAQALRKKFPHLTKEQSADIVRFTMNRYVGHANFHALIMSTPVEYVKGGCPICGAAGASRERRPNGNDKCVNGHTYPSKDANQ